MHTSQTAHRTRTTTAMVDAVSASSSAPKARWTPVAPPKCQVCDKSVYEQEKLVADGKTFHKTCFRCGHCKKVLSLGSYASLNEKTYCKVRCRLRRTHRTLSSCKYGSVAPPPVFPRAFSSCLVEDQPFDSSRREQRRGEERRGATDHDLLFVFS